METCLVYITCPTEEVAKTIARALIQQKLAACANIVPAIQSIYQWKAELVEETETLLLLKSRFQHFEALETVVRQHHPYEVPAIVALNIQEGHPPFLDWIRSETGN